MQTSINYKIYVCILFFTCLFFRSTTAQIVIDSNEYNTTIGLKHYLYEADENTGTGFTVDVGQSGGPHHWEFTLEQFPNGNFEEYTVVDPATTPLSANFPGANHAWFMSDVEDSTNMWIYFNINSTSISQLGMAFARGDSSEIMKSIPEDVIIKCPATLNTSWTDNYATHSGTAGVFEYIDSTSSEAIIDAWGTITLPSGTYDCLRVFKQETDFYLTYAFGQLIYADTSTYVNYDWMTEGVGLLAGVASIDGLTDPNFTKAGYVTMRVNEPAGITDSQSRIIKGFELHQNYPNPFNPKTVISYTVGANHDSPLHIDLSIYNLLGQKVATLVSEKQSAGTYKVGWDASGLASGIYLYKLETAQGFSQIKKLVVLK